MERRYYAQHKAGLILARGGSKSIPLKNLATVGGVPLLIRALDAMLDADCFDAIWVSTDHGEIARAATDHPSGRVRVFHRKAEFARDESTSLEAVAEFLMARPEVDVVGLVQCTSPFVKPEFIRRADELISLANENYDSVFSATRTKKLRWERRSSGKVDDGGGGGYFPANLDPERRPRRQDWSGDIVENGMFYFAKRSLVLNRGLLQSSGHSCSIVEVPAAFSLEIDSTLDLALAEETLKYLK